MSLGVVAGKGIGGWWKDELSFQITGRAAACLQTEPRGARTHGPRLKKEVNFLADSAVFLRHSYGRRDEQLATEHALESRLKVRRQA